MITHRNNFTALRLALALLVVLGHFAVLPSAAPAHGIFGYSTFAVNTFFVISGYLIYASFDQLPIISGFYIRRLFRIYPLYFIVVLVQGLAMAVLAGGILEHGTELLRYLAVNLIFVNFLAYDIGGLLNGLHNPGINPSLWTLKIEVAFYLVLPLLAYFTQRLGGRFLLLLYVLSTAYVTLTLQYGFEELSKQLPGQMRFFVVGMALYYYRDKFTFPTLPLVCIATILFVSSSLYDNTPLVLLLNPICSGLVMFLCAYRLPHIPLSFDISYGVYLLHGPLIQFALLFGIFSNTIGFLALLLVVVLLLAFLAEQTIELPGIKFGKRLAYYGATKLNKYEA